MRSIRVSLVAVIVAGMMAVGASSALAVTVSPAGAISTKQNAPFNFGMQSKLTCPEVTAGGTVNEAGAGNFTQIAFKGCTDTFEVEPGYGKYTEPVSFTPMTGWLFQISRATNGATTTAFSNVVLRFTLTNHPECSIDISGNWNSLTGSTIGAFFFAPKEATTTHLYVSRSSSCTRALKVAQYGEAVTMTTNSVLVLGTRLTVTP